ncbi:hypothetical protein [Mycolicibacterium vinylchloridicum]|nr:hypothetical protein [Mycolicibacterium vinylchloridicum]
MRILGRAVYIGVWDAAGAPPRLPACADLFLTMVAGPINTRPAGRR